MHIHLTKLEIILVSSSLWWDFQQQHITSSDPCASTEVTSLRWIFASCRAVYCAIQHIVKSLRYHVWRTNRRLDGGNHQNCRSDAGVYFYYFSDSYRKLFDLHFGDEIPPSQNKHEFYLAELSSDRPEHGSHYGFERNHDCDGEMGFWWVVLPRCRLCWPNALLHFNSSPVLLERGPLHRYSETISLSIHCYKTESNNDFIADLGVCSRGSQHPTGWFWIPSGHLRLCQSRDVWKR